MLVDISIWFIQKGKQCDDSLKFPTWSSRPNTYKCTRLKSRKRKSKHAYKEGVLCIILWNSFSHVYFYSENRTVISRFTTSDCILFRQKALSWVLRFWQICMTYWQIHNVLGEVKLEREIELSQFLWLQSEWLSVIISVGSHWTQQLGALNFQHLTFVNIINIIFTSEAPN